MKEMLEAKNRLAYEKGGLQTQVEQLQSQMENLASANTDYAKLKKANTLLETNYQKVAVLTLLWICKKKCVNINS